MHAQFLQHAVELAFDNVASLKGGPFGAIICQDQRIIASATNTVTSEHDPTAHAEINAIRMACTRLNTHQLTDCILYSSCEPCPMCLGAIYWARFKAVYFACNRLDAAAVGFDDSFIYTQIALPAEQRQIAMQCLTLSDATKPFIAWQQQANKQPY